MSSPVRLRVITILVFALTACRNETPTERAFELHGQILAIRPSNERLITKTGSAPLPKGTDAAAALSPSLLPGDAIISGPATLVTVSFDPETDSPAVRRAVTR